MKKLISFKPSNLKNLSLNYLNKRISDRHERKSIRKNLMIYVSSYFRNGSRSFLRKRIS